MKISRTLTFLALAGLLAAAATPAQPLRLHQDGGGVTHVRVEGELDVGAQALLRRAIDDAYKREDRLIIELDTPGGEVQTMWSIAKLIDREAFPKKLRISSRPSQRPSTPPSQTASSV